MKKFNTKLNTEEKLNAESLTLDYSEYFKKLRGCYMGKCIGGTLGMPYEGDIGLQNLTYYNPVPSEMVANDDLDLQVVFLEAVRRHGLPVNRRYLANAWLENIRMVFDEYGIAFDNIRKKLYPPLSGAYGNHFYKGMGASIRAELWACLCPGNPELAASLAREDACIDHHSDGVDAACFWAAMVSCAFVTKDKAFIIATAMDVIPENSLLNKAFNDTINWWEETGDFKEVREKIVEKYYSQNFTDVIINMSFILLGFLSWDGDFGNALCTAVNCGYDTDCVGASLGALLGALEPDLIGDDWSSPIGNALVLSGCMIGMHEPKTIDELCEQIAALSTHVQDYYDSNVKVVSPPAFPDYANFTKHIWTTNYENISLSNNYKINSSVIALSPVYIELCHPQEIAIPLGETGAYSLNLRSNFENSIMAYTLNLVLPDGWKISKAEHKVTLYPDKFTVINFEVKAPKPKKLSYLHNLDIILTNKHQQIRTTAGLAVAVPWRIEKTDSETKNHPNFTFFKNNDYLHAPGRILTLPKGRHLLGLTVKNGARTMDSTLVVEGTRKLKVWFDGKHVLSTDGCHYVPAVHRSKNHCVVTLKEDWQELIIETDDGEEGEFFLGFAKPFGLEWVEDLEYMIFN